LFCGNQLTSIPETSILRRKVATRLVPRERRLLAADVPQCLVWFRNALNSSHRLVHASRGDRDLGSAVAAQDARGLFAPVAHAALAPYGFVEG
jgi:hypothetical protein